MASIRVPAQHLCLCSHIFCDVSLGSALALVGLQLGAKSCGIGRPFRVRSQSSENGHLGEWVGEWSGAEIQIRNINRGLVCRGAAELFAESRTAPEDAVLCQRALGRSETTYRLAPKDAVTVWCVCVVVVVASLLFRGEPRCARGRYQEFPLLPPY